MSQAVIRCNQGMKTAVTVLTLLVPGVAGPFAMALDGSREVAFEWRESSPEEQGMDGAALEGMRQSLAEHGTKGLLVIRNDKIVCEWYRQGHGADKQHYTASMAKAVVGGVSLAVAISDGLITLDDPAARFVPSWRDDPRKSKIAIRHLGSHTSGIEDAEADGLPHDKLAGWKGDFWQRLDAPRGPFRLSRDTAPVLFEPGERMQYSNPGIAMLTYCVTAALQDTPHKDVRTLLRERVMRPIGVADSEWSIGYGRTYAVEGLPLVASWGGGGYTARAAARVGRLVLREGDWEGRQLISREAVRLVTRDVGTPGNCGIGWWSNNDGSYPGLPRDAFWGSGAGHQILLVVPSLDLIAVRNGEALETAGPEPNAYHSPLRRYLFGPLMAAVKESLSSSSTERSAASQRLRLMIETDAGGDPDDEQSLVRFLLYANEWDVEGIIANRPQTRRPENKNPEDSGLGIVHRLLDAYGRCRPNLVLHDARYPTKELLWQRAVAGYDDTDDGVKLIIAAVDRDDPRPLWYSDWGTDHGAAVNNLQRALDRVLQERGPEGYARFKSKLRLSSSDAFGDHTAKIAPPFRIWVNTFGPEIEGKRWYHRFSALTAKAGGFDLKRDVLAHASPLGSLYPTNTTHWAKEGDTMTFLYLVPTGMNDPNEPSWGSWAGRYGLDESFPGKPYYWANQIDTWQGVTTRDNTLARWAADLQNDFRARLDWCVKPPDQASHAPHAVVNGIAGRELLHVTARPGQTVSLDAGPSSDPDGGKLAFEWFVYHEAGTYGGEVTLTNASSPTVLVQIPADAGGKTIHVVLAVRDDGSSPLAAYRRVIVQVSNEPATPQAVSPYFPVPESQGGWRKLDEPEAIRRVAGMDPAKLVDLKEWLLQSDDRDFAAVVIRRGCIVLEVERGNSAKTDSRRVASVSKAVCATVLAIASEQSRKGLTPRKMTFDDPAFDFIPWAHPLSDPRKAQITVRQLLNHTSGLCPEANGSPNDGAWEYILGHSGDPRTATLAFDPGTGCGYSTHALHHASLVCETVTGKPYDQFAIEALFKPLGVEHWWFQYFEGGEKTGRHPTHGLGMPARDLARIAYCMLREGRWGDRQVIPRWFVEETAAPTHDVRTPEMRWKLNPQIFSHGWELPARHSDEGGRSGAGIPADARHKPGSGGQLIAFVPSLDLVITRQTGRSGDWPYEEYLRRACAAVAAGSP